MPENKVRTEVVSKCIAERWVAALRWVLSGDISRSIVERFWRGIPINWDPEASATWFILSSNLLDNTRSWAGSTTYFLKLWIMETDILTCLFLFLIAYCINVPPGWWEDVYHATHDFPCKQSKKYGCKVQVRIQSATRRKQSVPRLNIPCKSSAFRFILLAPLRCHVRTGGNLLCFHSNPARPKERY